MSSPEHSILIVGCGSIGERHLRCFQKTGRAAVTACEPNESLLHHIAATYKVPSATDWKQAIRDGSFDAMVICTPAPLHVPIARAALNSGLHVLIEKPLSHSLEGVSGLLEARERSGCVAEVAYIYHQLPFLTAARKFLADAGWEPILHASVTTGQAFHLLRPAYAQTYYRQRETGGGAIQDALTHCVNWIESLLGPTESLLCDCAHLHLPEVEVEDTVVACARQRNGALVSYTLNQFQHPNENSIQLNAARGSVRIEFHNSRWGVFGAGDAQWQWHECGPYDRDTHFTAQANAFLDKIEGKPANLCSLESAMQTLRFNLAALEAAESNRRVNLSSKAEGTKG